MRFVAEESWYGTESGHRVKERHPLARFLIVAKGAEIDDSEFNRYPILEENGEQVKPEPKAKAIDRPPENKAIEGAPRRKRGRPPRRKLEEPE